MTPLQEQALRGALRRHQTALLGAYTRAKHGEISPTAMEKLRQNQIDEVVNLAMKKGATPHAPGHPGL